jgi:hypothetical protein
MYEINGDSDVTDNQEWKNMPEILIVYWLAAPRDFPG